MYRIFFHSSSVLNNKDLIILTFITIAGYSGLCQPVDKRIVRKIDALVNEGVKDTHEMKRHLNVYLNQQIL